MLPWAAIAWVAGVAPAGFAWHAPEGCPTADAVRAEVEQLAGTPLDGLSLAASATVSAEPWTARLELQAGGRSSLRRFRGEDCHALADAVAVVVAIAASAEVAERSALARTRQPVRGRMTTGAVRARWPWLWTTRAALGVHWGGLPGVAGQVRAGFGISRGPWQLHAEGWLRGASERQAFQVPYDVDAVGGALLGCRVWGRRRWVGSVCAVTEWGSQRIRTGVGESEGRLWGAPGLDGTAGVWLGRAVELWVSAEVRVPVVRPRLQVDAEPGPLQARVTVFRAEPVTVGGSIGLFFQFP